MKLSPEQLIVDIGELIKEGYQAKDDPSTLARVIYDIAAKKWALGYYQAEFEELERGMKAELELDKANLIQKAVDDGDAVNKAEIKATIELGAKRRDYNKMVANVTKLKICRTDSEDVINAARSQLSEMKSERLLTQGTGQ